MEPALSKGFILIKKSGKEPGDMQYAYSFAHDQIQKAAAALTPESQRAALHVHIGRILKNELSDDQLDDAIFDIIDHLNHGIDPHSHVLEGVDKEELIHLNLVAGKKAKANAAWAPGFDYLRIAMTLLGQNSWGNAYKLTLDIHDEIAEAAYLCGRYRDLSKFADAVFQNAITHIDKERAYISMIRAFTAAGNLNDAVKIGIQALAEYGVNFPQNPKKIHVILEIIKTKIALSGKTTADLLNLPELVDPEKQALCRLLSYTFLAMFISSSMLVPILIARQLQLIVKHGHSSTSAFFFLSWGLVPFMNNDSANGYKFGKLALKFIDRYDNKEFGIPTLIAFNGHVRHWRESIHQTFLDKENLLKAGLNNGVFEWIPILLSLALLNHLVASKTLFDLIKETQKGIDICRQINQSMGERWLTLVIQFAHNFSSLTQEPFYLKGDYFDEAIDVPIYHKIKDYSGYTVFLITKAWSCYLCEKYELAIDCIKKINPFIRAQGGFPSLTYIYFYGSLSLLAVYPDKPWHEQIKIKLRVFLNQKWLKKRADLAPENFLNKYHLVEAEHYRVKGEDAKAAEYYDKAIEGAKTNRFIHEEAMANEVAAKFYAGKKDMAKARGHMGRAKHCYAQWGAMAKVKHLEDTFPELLPEDIPAERKTTSGTTTTQPIKESQLDLTSVIKASQVISGEIEIKKLLTRVMDIIIENAGAQKGCLILKSEDDRFCIEAQGHIDGKDSLMPESIPVTNSNLVPESIIQYVARTKESLVIADATDHHEFATDVYILENRPKSILCAPLIHRNKTSGIVYLENNLTTGAFTTERVEILSLLCSQAAISLENADMYQQQQAYAQTLEEKVAERTAELNQSLDTIKKTRDQLVQSEKMAALGSLVAGVAHEVNTPIGVAVSAASHLEDMTSAFVSKMESNQVKRSDLNQYTKTAATASTLILKNLSTAVKIVQGFKQVAVDQTSGERREFRLKAYIEDVLLSLQPKLKKTKHTIRVDCPDDLLLNSFPGAFSQIISNLIMNSLLHGFEGIETGEIVFEVRQENTNILFIYRDNGRGMTDQTLARIFDPFFT
ncbi:MAG: GAF domain-containing protein, partial [Desulfatirhabdiaceae bacterium]